ncbi:MAG: hypothetical protein ACRDLQ_04410 [Solirubrobacterales bacterium]
MSSAAELRWAELLGELRLLRELVAGQNELLAALLQAQQRMEEDIRRGGLA